MPSKEEEPEISLVVDMSLRDPESVDMPGVCEEAEPVIDVETSLMVVGSVEVPEPRAEPETLLVAELPLTDSVSVDEPKLGAEDPLSEIEVPLAAMLTELEITVEPKAVFDIDGLLTLEGALVALDAVPSVAVGRPKPGKPGSRSGNFPVRSAQGTQMVQVRLFFDEDEDFERVLDEDLA